VIAYYNEIDPYVAQWLRNLITAGHIAPGYVDERSIEDVYPSDLAGFTQCHFFAGIGVWSLALRRAGWPDDRPVWTGSCPCQPFSAAGKGVGFADERHLWPAFHHLIKERKPAKVYGEQVASKDADTWIDLVHTDMEALGYAFGAVPFPSAGIGAPHIRDRAYWMADADHAIGRAGSATRNDCNGKNARRAKGTSDIEGCGSDGRMGNTESERWDRRAADTEEPTGRNGVEVASITRGLAHTDLSEPNGGGTSSGEQSLCDEDRTTRESDGTGPTNGFWRDADWIGCTDGLWRPIESGTFPLADGVANRMGKLRAFGNAINAKAAQEVIEATMEIAA